MQKFSPPAALVQIQIYDKKFGPAESSEINPKSFGGKIYSALSRIHRIKLPEVGRGEAGGDEEE